MTHYRSLATIEAVQYTGKPIPGVTCEATNPNLTPIERAAVVEHNGCDPSRKQLPHVHTKAVGGMTVLKENDWIMPVDGGPFVVWSDEQFRVYWEVPTAETVVKTPPPVTVAPTTGA